MIEAQKKVPLKKKVVLMIVAAGAAVSLLAPVAGSARAQAACVMIKSGPVNIQLGYAQKGPRDCTRLP